MPLAIRLGCNKSFFACLVYLVFWLLVLDLTWVAVLLFKNKERRALRKPAIGKKGQRGIIHIEHKGGYPILDCTIFTYTS